MAPHRWGAAAVAGGPPLPLLLAMLLPRAAEAPVPCTSALKIAVEVGGKVRAMGLTQTIEHGDFEERVCETVNIGYMGMIVLGCDEGFLNQTAEGCEPKECMTYDALSVTLGDLTWSIMPLQTIPHEGSEERLCRIINPLYRGTMTLFCNYGALTIDTSDCVTQWDPMDRPPWRARSRHAAVGLSGGPLLLLGGLGDEGPLREVWQWTPEGDLSGRWERPWARPIPPWTGRFGTAAVRQVKENGEQVTVLGGNDGQNRRDVWRWLRDPSPIDLPLAASDTTGTQPRDCSLDGSGLTCNATEGVSGRRWYVPFDQWPAFEVTVDLQLSPAGDADEAADGEAVAEAAAADAAGNATGRGSATAIIAVQLDTCRQVFQVLDGSWSTYGCTGTDPPWVESHEFVRLGVGGETPLGERQTVRLVINRESMEVELWINGTALLPRSKKHSGQLGVALDLCPAGGGAGVCSAHLGAGPPDLALKVIEVAAWPNTSVNVQRMSLMVPAGGWQQLVDDAPWPARASHAVVALPDGDLLLMGGLGQEGLLSDVWRWSPRRCTLLPDLDPFVAARYELECSFECQASPTFGQWKQLPPAPWAARQEHTAMWTAAGLLLLGGRTAGGFENDVWRWTSSGEFCSLAWQGQWELITAAAAWPPRHGHSIVGFTPMGASAPETILLVAGFGGEPEREDVEREPLEYPVTSRSDLWCGNKALGNFSTWTRLAPYGPFSSRAQAGAVQTPSMGPYAMVFFGGYDVSARLVVDMWRWTGENATADCRVEDAA